MNRYIDLHTHSTCSDGTLSPSELVKLAKEKGLAAIALTDHDTIDGLHEAIKAGEKYGIEVITGIEFSVKADVEMHMLGLHFSLDCPRIKEILDTMIRNREKRNRKLVNILCDLGLPLTMEDVLCEATSNVVGRSQFAKTMVKKGYVKNVSEAFDKYLAFGRPAFLPRETLSPKDAIKIIKDSGGIASLAHLNQIDKSDEELFEILKHLKACGLDAVEGYYTEYTEEMNRKYRKMAADLGLKVSGGSDFHGTNKIGHDLGTGNGNLRIPYQTLCELKA